MVLRPGPHSAAPAAFFTSSLPEVEVEATGSSHRGHGGQNIPRQRKLKVNFKSDHLLWSALSRSELALVASIRQWEGNSGTLLSLSSGSQRYVKKIKLAVVHNGAKGFFKFLLKFLFNIYICTKGLCTRV